MIFFLSMIENYNSNLQTKFGVPITSNIKKQKQILQSLNSTNAHDLPILEAYPAPGVPVAIYSFSECFWAPGWKLLRGVVATSPLEYYFKSLHKYSAPYIILTTILTKPMKFEHKHINQTTWNFELYDTTVVCLFVVFFLNQISFDAILDDISVAETDF